MKVANFVPKIVFDKGALEYLEEFNNESVFIVTDQFISSLPVFEEMKSQLSQNNKVVVFNEVIPDPPIDNLIAGMKVMMEALPTVIVAIGGGSPIDAAKGIMYFACQSDQKMRREDIEFVVVPTTSGTGSEATNFAVITDGDTNTKYPLVNDDVLPDIALLDTDLVLNLPPNITADTGIDVLTHAIEAYVSNDANPFSDALAEKAIKMVFDNLETAFKEGENNYTARENMHYASAIAGLAFNISSLGINHSLAHALGGQLHLPHGRINGVLLKEVILYNSGLSDRTETPETLRARQRYTEIAQMIGIKIPQPQLAIQQLVQKINRLLKILSMPTSFSEWDVDRSEYSSLIEEVAQNALEDRCTSTNPRTPEVKGLEYILGESY